jgi:hypothetical protein
MDKNSILEEQELSPVLIYELSATAKIARIIGIFGFISIGISLISFIKKIVGGVFTGSSLVGILITATISGTLSYFMFQFGTKASVGSANNDVQLINEGFSNLKSYYQLLGILLIILASMVVIALLLVLIFKR